MVALAAPWIRRTYLPAALGVLAGVGAFSAPIVAQACGGTFCDAGGPGPQGMPVPQSGETVVFVMEEGMVEAHIQIEVAPDVPPDRFAWIIPIPEVPQLEVGSEPFIGALEASTRRTEAIDRDVQDCPACPSQGDPGDSASATFSGGSDDCGSFLGCDDSPGVPGAPDFDVVLSERVGAFDATVLSAQSIDDVMSWLGDNGYERDPDAAPILQDYLDEGQLLLALKLTPSSETDAVHPLVVRYPGDQPCIPLRLTRIAAEADMPIRAIFLDSERFVPSNWAHVLVNELAVRPWDRNSFEQVVTLAVDEAGGHAWVTEMADETPDINSALYLGAAWDAEAFIDLPPEALASTLWAQGLVSCAFDGFQNACTLWPRPVSGVVSETLTVPEGFDVAAWISNQTPLPPDVAADSSFDGERFAALLSERVIEPALRAETILAEQPFTTRLFTTISPHEMTEDPMFHRSEWMGITRRVRSLRAYAECHGWTTWFLPSGLELSLPTDNRFEPGVWPSNMPFAQRIETVPPVGPPVVHLENLELLRSFASWRTAVERYPGAWPGGAYCEDGPMMGDPPEDPAPPGANGPDASLGSDDALSRGGCACDVVEPTGPAPGRTFGSTSLCVLMLVGLRRRRRRRSAA